MRLSIEKRTRILSLYYKHGLGDKKKRFQKLTNFAAMEDIFISSRRVRDLINKWNETMSLDDLPSVNRAILHTRVTQQELIDIDRAVYRNRELTGPQLKASLNLRSSVRSVQRYLRRLGWRKVENKSNLIKTNTLFI